MYEKMQNNETSIFTLYFADDQVQIAQDQNNLKYMPKKFLKKYEK